MDETKFSLPIVNESNYDPEKLDKNWIEFLDKEANFDIQTDCESKRWKPDGEVKCSAILFHGFTACSQQVIDLAEELKKKNCEVFAPRLPGHGLKPRIQRQPTKQINCGPWYFPWLKKKCDSKIKDNIGYLPYSKEEYAKFVNETNNFMKYTKEPRSVFGLSLGGMIAAFSGSTTIESENNLETPKMMYDNQFLSVPLIDLPTKIIGAFIEGSSSLPLIRNIQFSWGEACEFERKKGRAGFCNFNIGNLDAAKDFGRDCRKLLRNRNFETNQKTQIVKVNNDSSISNIEVDSLYNEYKGKKNLCILEEIVGHSYISKYDNIDQNKFWLNEITKKISDFMTQDNDNENLDFNGFLKKDSKDYCKLDFFSPRARTHSFSL